MDFSSFLLPEWVTGLKLHKKHKKDRSKDSLIANNKLQEFFLVFTSSINAGFMFLYFKPVFVSIAHCIIQNICNYIF